MGESETYRYYSFGHPVGPVQPLDLSYGDAVKFKDDRYWWKVQAVSENYAVCVRNAPFQPADDPIIMYTVIDWRSGVRGPCNLIGQGFGDGTYSREECEEMLRGFEYDYRQDPDYLEAVRAHAAGEIDRVSWPSKMDLQVSHRNFVPIQIQNVKEKS